MTLPPAIALLLLLHAAPTPVKLENLLHKASASRRQADTALCGYQEDHVVDELDKDGKPTAQETHHFAVEVRAGKQKRTLLNVEKDFGQLTSELRPKQDQELSAEQKASRQKLFQPLNAEEQAFFHFDLKELDGKGRAEVTLAPLSPSPDRLQGSAWIDVKTGRMVSLKASPSQMPPKVRRLEIRADFKNTVCGVWPVKVELTGEGGVLFIVKRFHSTITHRAFRLLRE